MDDILAFVIGLIVGSLITLPYANTIKQLFKKIIKLLIKEEAKQIEKNEEVKHE